MKRCDYCRREADDDSASCPQCGRRLGPEPESGTTPPLPAPPLPTPKFIRPEAFAHAFLLKEGFHRANWSIVRDWIEANVSAANHSEAWSETALHWVSHLRDDLGPDYYVLQSKTTVLLSNQPLETAQWLLRYAGAVANKIQSELPNLAWDGAIGRDVVLVFSELDDYDRYVAFHCQEGVQPQSGGVCIDSGYPHVAIPWQDVTDAANALVHELTHGCLAHLDLPTWLNEGVAQALQRLLAPPPLPPGGSEQDSLFAAAINWRPPLMWDELAERHFGFWNEHNIQSFWAGTSFHEPGDACELSYSLAEVLVKLLLEKGAHLPAFLQRACPEDAGQTAALEIFHVDLGELAATFLGAGDWRPQRQAIAEHWQAAGWDAPPAPREHAH